jgi:hypothetical protein
VFGNALIDFVLYRAYMKDAEYAGNNQRAAQHYQLFVSSISQGGQAQSLLSPNNPTGALPVSGAGG